MSVNSSFRTSLSDVIAAAIDTALIDVNVCLPAKIVTYDKSTQYADVEIQIMQTYSDGSTVATAVIPNVPVKHPRAAGGAAFMHFPLTAGDDVVLVFSQRSLDNWKSQGGMTDPQDVRKHHITDCYALIGGSAIPDAFTPATDDAIEITNGGASIEVHPDGKFKITNGTDELVSLLYQLVNTLSTDTTNTLLGPMQLNSFETYSQIAEKIQNLMEDS